MPLQLETRTQPLMFLWPGTSARRAGNVSGKKDNKLIRKWDSEREHFYNDNVHVLQYTKITL